MKIAYTLIAVFFLTLTSCTENQWAKQFGGTMSIDLPPGMEFVTATWKEEQLWYTYRPRKEGETADTVIMRESSNYGIVEGEVHFIEH